MLRNNNYTCQLPNQSWLTLRCWIKKSAKDILKYFYLFHFSSIGLNYSRQATIKGVKHLNYFELLINMSLLLIAGVERNPGSASKSSVSSNPSHINKEQKMWFDISCKLSP